MTMLKTISGSVARLFTNRTALTVGTLSLLSTAIVVAAVQSEGATATNVQLDDGAVWVTNEQRNAVGRLNVKINELDAHVKGPGSGLQVLQDGRTVLYTGREGGVKRVDVYTNEPSGSNEIPIVDYQIGGGVGAVLDPETGYLWTGAAEQIVAPEYPKKPDAIVGAGSRLLVTQAVPQTQIKNVTDGSEPPRGRVIIVDTSGWYEVPLGEDFKPIREGADKPDEESSGTTTDDSSGDDSSGDDSSGAGTASATDAGSSDEAAVNGKTEEKQPDPIFELPRTSFGGSVSDLADVTAVGGEIVVLTPDNEVVFGEHEPVKVPGEHVRLQQPGLASGEVVVASTKGLYTIGLDDAAKVTPLFEVEGTPSAPAVANGCRYGAWSGEKPKYARWCESKLRTKEPTPVERAQPDAVLVWRVNRNTVALNATGNGDVWADHEGTLAYAGNWDDLEAQDDLNEPEDAPDKSRVVVERQCQDGGDQVPISSDDQVGVRPRQSILDVLYNDDDLNCEPIAITGVQPTTGEWGALTVIDNGQHLLYSPSDAFVAQAKDQIVSFQFTYSAVDVGGNESSPSTVTVSMKDLAVGNQPPGLRPKLNDKTREMRAVVEEGQSVSYNVMADWWDPDGDDLRLVSAVPENAGEVSSTPDGLVRYAANGVSPGIQNVDITLSDGSENTTEKLEITIKPIGSSLPPVTTNDFVTLTVGQTATVAPLANDSDPNENPLSLSPKWPNEADQGYRTSLDGDEVHIVGEKPGVYNLRYEASDGEDATGGWIRVSIAAPGDTNQAPVAVPDQVKLRPNRVINVDVLANDVDPDGDTLAVIAADVAASDGALGVARASVVDRRMVQVEVVPGPNGEEPTGPFTISYQVTDGFDAVRAAQDRPADIGVAEQLQGRGAVTVLVQPSSDDQPPILLPDEVVVRTRDIASVPVLRNDIDPDSDELTLIGVEKEQSAKLEQSDQAVVWIEGREVFVQGGQPGRYSILYSVEAGGRTASSELSIVVKPAVNDTDNPNQAPQPINLNVRAVRNNTVRVKVPLTGVDPDGDSVELIDQISIPEQGRNGNRAVLDLENPDTILYTASPASEPTDSFTYTVRDRFGLESVGTVNVMVLNDDGWPPQAHDDVWRGKPGRTLSIPIVANDSSPQDRRLELAELPFFDAAGQPSAVPVSGDAVRLLDQADPDSRGRVEVVVPNDESTLSEHYRISDGFNGSDAYIRVTPDPNTPNMRPIAQVDEVALAEVREIELGQTVAVDVLKNDYDPDDAATALRYSVPANQPGTFDSNGVLQIPVALTAQIVLYRITDGDDGTTVGVVHVPGKENHPPVLNDVGRDASLRTVEAGATEPITIKVADITQDPDNDPKIVLTDTEVSVVGDIGEVKRLDDGSGFQYFPPPEIKQTTTVGIAFEVTDRPDESPEARAKADCNCLAPLVVDVVLEASTPPRVLAPGAARVPQLDEPVTVDVTPLTVDDQGDPLTYEFDSGSFGGLDVKQSGPTLTITAKGTGASKLDAGRQITLRYSVSDGKFDPVDNVVVVTIIKTNKGQPAAGALGPFEAVRDKPLTLPNLLSTAVNPFAGDGHPLTLVNYSVTGGGSLTCSDSGACQFSSSSKDVRQFTVNYTIKDAVEQTANGSFQINMKGLPLAPGVPGVQSVGDHQVNLSWTAADMQGGTLKAYHVTAIEAGITKTFTQTGGTFDGLKNATEYHFTVTAENELGLGEPSASSSVAVPDRVPDPPVGMVFTDYRDQSLSLQWSPPPTSGDFSAIIQYEVSIGGQSIKVEGGATSLTVGLGGKGSPLQNGTDYSFKVRAQNSAKTDNGWGAWSSQSANTQRPSRFPDPPTGVKGANSGDGGAPRITVTWNAPGFDGGRAITSYNVCRVEGGACQSVGGGARQATFAGLGRGESASFTVVAVNSDKNRANSDPSPASAGVVAVGNPDPPSLNSVTTGDHSLQVNFTPQNNSGCSSASTEFSINGGGSWQTGATFSGLTNGQSYTIVGRTKLASSCGTPGQTYTSVNSNTVTATPYGPLRKPIISPSGGGTTTITWDWNTNRTDDRRPGWSASLSGDCGNQDVTGQPTGAISKEFPRDGRTVSCTITVSAPGVPSESATQSAKVKSPLPPKRVWATKDGPYGACTYGLPVTCYYFTVHIEGFEPGSYSITCFPGEPVQRSGGTISAGGDSGSGSRSTSCAAGSNADAVVVVDGVTGTGTGW